MYVVKCAWCGKDLHYSETENSHGICADCKRVYIEEPLKREYGEIHSPDIIKSCVRIIEIKGGVDAQ